MGCYQFERVMSQRNSSASAPPSNAAHASAASAVVASLQMIGNSPAFRSILREISRIAGAAAPVLIEGETGSGKEVAARAVHYLGTRREWPFIPINCGAIPDNLAEAELFGHERGAFTDARQARRGLVAEADGGTLFLDEVDALSPKAQVTLLRFLQDQRYRPLGRGTELRSDVRIIAASNARLTELVECGQFRGDLFFRLNVLELHMPPLRDRPGDAELLGQHFLRKLCAKYTLPPKRFHPDTLRWMGTYSWPGNVRELENVVHRQMLLTDGEEIVYCGGGKPTAATHLTAAAYTSAAGGPEAPPASEIEDFRVAKARAIEEFERNYLSRLLAHSGGNVTAAARLAGKERRALGKLLKKHGIDRVDFSS